MFGVLQTVFIASIAPILDAIFGPILFVLLQISVYVVAYGGVILFILYLITYRSQ